MLSTQTPLQAPGEQWADDEEYLNVSDPSPTGRRGSYVVPQQSFKHELLRAMPLRVLCVLATSITLSCLLVFVLLGSSDISCLGNTPRWKPVLVFNLMVLFCVLVIRGVNAEFALLGISAIAVLADCLKPNDLFLGASSNAVVSLALLFPIAKAMADTGVPDRFIGRVMGNPSTVRPGIARMFMALFAPSAIFNNTPIVAMMIPVLQSWSKRLGFDVRIMLLPLTFAAQAGGNLSLMGSSINFVAKQTFSNATGGEFDIGFFSLTLGGIILYALVGFYCTIAGPLLLQGRSIDANTTTECSAEEGSVDHRFYNICFVVEERGPLVDLTAEAAGLHRVKGVSCTCFPPKLYRGGKQIADGWMQVSHVQLRGEDELCIGASAEGVAELRRVRGLELVNEQSELVLLGAKRRTRTLVEASVSNGLVGKSISTLELKRSTRCAVVSVQSQGEVGLFRKSYHGYDVRLGDVLLLEAFAEDIGSDDWNRLFGVVRKVPKSSPPRKGRRADTLRAVATGVGLLIAVILCMFGNRLGLTITCVLLLCALFTLKAMTPEAAYEAVNASVLLIIVGALAVGQTLQDVKLATCFADGVVNVAEPMGKFAILAALYLATFALGFFVTNAAVVAIMGQIGAAIAADSSIDVSIGEVCLVIVYGASACFCTPYGYQTNLMVAKEAGYSWGDFIRFGILLQFVHLVLTISISPILGNFVF